MKTVPSGYRVAVVGSSSLLGKELLAVLEDRQFPVSRLVKVDEDDSPEVPILDLSDYSPEDRAKAAEALAVFSRPAEEVAAEDLDFAFVARVPRQLPAFLAAESAGSNCVVIDLSGATLPDAVLSIPPLDRDLPGSAPAAASNRFVSPHPAAIVVASLLARTTARFPLTRAVGLVLNPASEIGPAAIAELQLQAVNLLSFHKIPQAVFGSQMAFNVLPRLGKSRRGTGHYHDELTGLDGRIRGELRRCLGGRAPMPALRLIQVSVFHSLVASLYLESESPAAPEAVERALAGSQFEVRRFSDQAPSPVESTEAAKILVDAISIDPDHPNGIWIWATADNMRLAATNAVEIAEAQALGKQAAHRTS